MQLVVSDAISSKITLATSDFKKHFFIHIVTFTRSNVKKLQSPGNLK